MSISVTEILGTDSLAGSRLVINDNFNVLADAVNDMLVYLNTSAGTFTNLTSITTNSLTVGLSSPKLQVTTSVFNITASPTIQGNLELQGNLYRDNVDSTLINEVTTAPSLAKNIGSSVAAPTYTIERVSNNGTAPITLTMFEGEIGQEIIFCYYDSTSGAVDIVADAGTALVLTGTWTKVVLSGIGQTAHFLCVPDSSNNPVWFLIGGLGYTLAS
jgi:hypothetical protein